MTHFSHILGWVDLPVLHISSDDQPVVTRLKGKLWNGLKEINTARTMKCSSKISLKSANCTAFSTQWRYPCSLETASLKMPRHECIVSRSSFFNQCRCCTGSGFVVISLISTTSNTSESAFSSQLAPDAVVVMTCSVVGHILRPFLQFISFGL